MSATVTTAWQGGPALSKMKTPIKNTEHNHGVKKSPWESKSLRNGELGPKGKCLLNAYNCFWVPALGPPKYALPP